MGQFERVASQVRCSIRIRLSPMYMAIVAIAAPKIKIGLTRLLGIEARSRGSLEPAPKRDE